MHEHVPEPTVWPSVLASGVTLAAAGLVNSPFVFAAGVVIAFVALAGWIRLLLRGDAQ